MARKKLSPDDRISKTMSTLLRHKAVEEGLDISKEGFVLVDQLLSNQRLKSLKVSLEDILRVVENDKKQRYTLRKSQINQESYEVCANQGHSLEFVQVGLTEMDSLYTGDVIHGTTTKNWLLIKESGYLSRMSRNHIHFAHVIPQSSEQGISTMRSSAHIYIFIDYNKAIEHGIKFFKSANEVILSPGDANGHIDISLFLKVVNKEGKTIYP